MAADPITVYIVDDDDSVRRALARVLRSAGIESVLLSSTQELLDLENLASRACVIADIRMPGRDALELPALLKNQGFPVIFLTAQDTESTRMAAKRAGAAGFFRKPVDDQALIDAIEWALRDEQRGDQDGH